MKRYTLYMLAWFLITPWSSGMARAEWPPSCLKSGIVRTCRTSEADKIPPATLNDWVDAINLEANKSVRLIVDSDIGTGASTDLAIPLNAAIRVEAGRHITGGSGKKIEFGGGFSASPMLVFPDGIEVADAGAGGTAILLN